MKPNLNQSQSLKVLPQFAAGATLPDGSTANQEVQQITFTGPATANSSIVIAGVTININKGDTPATMANNIASALAPQVTSGALTSATVTGSLDASGVKIAYPYSAGAVSTALAQPAVISPTVMTTQAYEKAGTTVDNLPFSSGLLTAGDKYTFTIATSATTMVNGTSTPVSLTVDVTVPADTSSFIATLNGAIADAGAKANLDSTDIPTVVDGPVSTDGKNTPSFDFEWSKSPAFVAPATANIGVIGDSANKGILAATSTSASAIDQSKIQTIDFGTANAASDMTMSVAGVSIDINKGDTPLQISQKAQTAIASAFPAPANTITSDPATGKLTITFAQASGDVKLVLPNFVSKKSPVMVSELSKFSTDPVLMQGLSIDSKGQVAATYSNGSTYTMGFLELANFANDAGLKDIGGNRFVQTGMSGQPVITAAGAPKAGNIMSGALEQANVDITSELMDMIRAQQVYNGNARVLQTTVDTVTKITDLR